MAPTSGLTGSPSVCMESLLPQLEKGSLTMPGNSTGSRGSRSGLKPDADFHYNHLTADEHHKLEADLARTTKLWWRCILAALLGGVGLVVAGYLTLNLIENWAPAKYTPDCFMPLGGGWAQPDGIVQHLNSTRCATQLRSYLAEGGLYYQEVERVAAGAVSFMLDRQHNIPATQDQLFIFDIDETALSNAEEWTGSRASAPDSRASEGDIGWFKRLTGSKAARALLVSDVQREKPQDDYDYDNDEWGSDAGGEGLLSRGHRKHDKKKHDDEKKKHKDDKGSDEPNTNNPQASLPRVLRGDPVDDRPALSPVLHLYLSLIHHNYSVAFVTGRKENARSATERNLLLAGYGEPCGSHNSTGPCYVALQMRDEDDFRPASVFKPEARGALKDMRYELVGNIGDQMSDGAGLNWAESFFKLPNAFYYII